MNKKHKIKNKAFSLFEILIVITIIGLLSTIVLTSLSNSRAKSYDSKVRQQLISFRTAAELYLQSVGNYGPDVSVCTSGMFSNISPSSGRPGIYIDPNVLPSTTELLCRSDGNKYAIKASMYSGNEYFCIDSTGASRLIQGQMGQPALSCP